MTLNESKLVRLVKSEGFHFVIFLLILLIAGYGIREYVDSLYCDDLPGTATIQHNSTPEVEANAPIYDVGPYMTKMSKYEYVYVDAKHQDMSRTFTLARD